MYKTVFTLLRRETKKKVKEIRFSHYSNSKTLVYLFLTLSICYFHVKII